MGVDDRLRSALELRGRSIRGFQHEMHERGVPGSAYASVYAYVHGRTTPPLDFLEAAADVLGVRRAWLLAGEGAPTEAQGERDKAMAAVAHALPRILYRPLARACPAFERADDTARLFVAAVWQRLLPATFAEESVDEAAQATEALGRALQAPLDLLGVDGRKLMDAEANAYFGAIASALNAVTRVPRAT